MKLNLWIRPHSDKGGHSGLLYKLSGASEIYRKLYNIKHRDRLFEDRAAVFPCMHKKMPLEKGEVFQTENRSRLRELNKKKKKNKTKYDS